jgi:hypothetical protein
VSGLPLQFFELPLQIPNLGLEFFYNVLVLILLIVEHLPLQTHLIILPFDLLHFISHFAAFLHKFSVDILQYFVFFSVYL